MIGSNTQRLLKILCCPEPSCRGDVRFEEPATGEDGLDGWLACAGCGRKYPVRDDIPVMLLDEAVSPPPR